MREVRAERPLQAGAAGQREGLHGRPVIGLGRRDHLPAPRFSALDVVAPRQLHGHLVGVRAAGHEAGAREPRRGHRHQLSGQLLLGWVGEPFVVDVPETLGLGLSGGDDVPAPVPERGGHRSSAHGVEVPPARRVLHPDPLAADDDRVAVIELQWEHVGPVAGDQRLGHVAPSGGCWASFEP